MKSFPSYYIVFLLSFLLLLGVSLGEATPAQLPINETAEIKFKSDLAIYYDPPSGTVSPTALGIYVWSNFPTSKIYYELLTKKVPDINSTFATADRPYIQVDTPFKAPRDRTIVLIAVYEDLKGQLWRSRVYYVNYFVEASARPNSFGYLIPGVESGGKFIQIGLEAKASARAQAAGAQEFADFGSTRGYGTYLKQVKSLNLTEIDEDLNGFEGGFCYNQSTAGPFYGLLIPFYNGVVRTLFFFSCPKSIVSLLFFFFLFPPTIIGFLWKSCSNQSSKHE
jgi:hypothetical protein